MNLFTSHPAILAIAAYWGFSALVGGMPMPEAKSSAGYRWLHDSLHILAGNLSAAVAAKYPQLPAGTVQVTETATVTNVPK